MPNLVRRFVGRRRLPIVSASSEPPSTPNITSASASSSSVSTTRSPETVPAESGAPKTKVSEVQISTKYPALISETQEHRTTKGQVSSIILPFDPIIDLFEPVFTETSLSTLSGIDLAKEEIIGAEPVNPSSTKSESVISSSVKPVSSPAARSTVKPRYENGEIGIGRVVPLNGTPDAKQNETLFYAKLPVLNSPGGSARRNEASVERKNISDSVRSERSGTPVREDFKYEKKSSPDVSSSGSIEAVLVQNDTLSTKGAPGSYAEHLGLNVTTDGDVPKSYNMLKGANVTVSTKDIALKSGVVSPSDTLISTISTSVAPTNVSLLASGAGKLNNTVLKGALSKYINVTNQTLMTRNDKMFPRDGLATNASASRGGVVPTNGASLAEGVISANGALFTGHAVSTNYSGSNRGFGQINETVLSKAIKPAEGTVHKDDGLPANDNLPRDDAKVSPTSAINLTYDTESDKNMETTVSPVSFGDANAAHVPVTPTVAHRSVFRQSSPNDLTQSTLKLIPSVHGPATTQETTFGRGSAINKKLNANASFTRQTSPVPSEAGPSSVAISLATGSLVTYIPKRRGRTTKRGKYRRRYRKHTFRTRATGTGNAKQTHSAVRHFTRKSKGRKQNKKTTGSLKGLHEISGRTRAKVVASSIRTESSAAAKNGTKNGRLEVETTYEPKIRAIEITHRHDSSETSRLASPSDTMVPFKEPRTVIPADAYLLEDFSVKYQRLVTKAMSFVNSDKNIQAMAEPVVEVDRAVYTFDVELFLTSLMSGIAVLDLDTEFVEAAPNLLQHVQNLTVSFDK
ncbi:unnamed protein product [Ixodes hexagonus]